MKTQASSLIGMLFLLLAANSANAFYDPGTQRWLNRDPIMEAGGRNLYAFVQNQPVNRNDYFGLEDPIIMSPGSPDMDCLSCEFQLWLKRASIMGRAANEARQDPVWGGIGHVDGPEDAIRHCLAGCYLAKAMRNIPACKGTSPAAVITDEEYNRSNRSRVDIENGIAGANAPPDADCQDHCSKAYADGKIKPERAPPYPIILPGGR